MKISTYDRVLCLLSSGNVASAFQEEDNIMKCMNTLVRTLGVVTLVGMASLALPFPVQAGGVQVSIGVGLPFPGVVYPAPVIVQRAPVIVTEPLVVAEPRVVYGYPYYRGSYRPWRHHHDRD
jgi:hypothetical protein